MSHVEAATQFQHMIDVVPDSVGVFVEVESVDPVQSNEGGHGLMGLDVDRARAEMKGNPMTRLVRALRNYRLALPICLVLVRCSAGVEENVDGSHAVAELVEELRIDGYDQDLVPIDGLVVGPEDEIIIQQQQESQIRYYDSTGAFMGTFGRAGEGPGEFSELREFGLVADTLWAWDPRLSRISLISHDRELVRSYVLERPIQATPSEFAAVGNAVIPQPRGLRRDGNVLVEFRLIAGFELPEPYANQIVLGAVTPGGRLESVVAQVRHGGPLAYSTGTGGGTIPYPLRNAAHAAVSDDGERIAGARTSLEGDQADSLSITVWDNTGSVLWSRAIPFERVPIPSTVVDSIFRRMDAFPARFRDAFREQVQVPPAFPPLRGLLVGRDGSVWIEMMVEDGVRPYCVLDAAGEVVGTVSLSESARIAAAELDRIWTIERDDLDVESVVRYALSWN